MKEESTMAAISKGPIELTAKELLQLIKIRKERKQNI